MTETKSPRKRRATTAVDFPTHTITFKFGDGDDAASFTVQANELSEEIRSRLVLHGLKQKLADSYADPDTDPRAEVEAGWAELLRGVWAARGEGGPRTTLLAEALAELKDRTVEDAQKFIDGIGVDEDGTVHEETRKAGLKALRTNPVIAAKMAQIEAKRKQERAKELAKAAKANAGELPNF